MRCVSVLNSGSIQGYKIHEHQTLEEKKKEIRVGETRTSAVIDWEVIQMHALFCAGKAKLDSRIANAC